MCDRICVMNDGRFVGEFTGAEATQEKIMHAIMRKPPPKQPAPHHPARGEGMRDEVRARAT